MVRCCIETKFLTILRVEGSPNAENLYRTLNTFVEAENLTKENLVSFTNDTLLSSCQKVEVYLDYYTETTTLLYSLSIV